MTVTMSSSSPLSAIVTTMGEDMKRAVEQCQILLVGAGGIGCELLKNLSLSGFRHVTVVDLDTIDISNLNRQLLFRSQHVGQPKCTVAAAAAQQLLQHVLRNDTSTTSTEDEKKKDSSAADDEKKSEDKEKSQSQAAAASSSSSYIAMPGNITDTSTFHVAFVQQFDLVLNALDNVTARRRVNRLCLAAQVPLLEAGTTGYLGQVSVLHKPSGTACYECTTQETAKVYPICTIRSTPSQPVHTIVWAKELYKLLFSPTLEDSMLYESMTGQEEESPQQPPQQHSESTATTSANANTPPSVETSTNNKNGEDTTETSTSTFMPAVLKFRKLIFESSSSLVPATATTPTNSALLDTKQPQPQKDNAMDTMEEDNDEIAILDLVKQIITALYQTEIVKQLHMGRYKNAAKVPLPLTGEMIEQGMDYYTTTTATSKPKNVSSTFNSTAIWNETQCIAEFTNSLVRALRIQRQKKENDDNNNDDDDMEGAAAAEQDESNDDDYYDEEDEEDIPQAFDKDSTFCMTFVTAASNLRSAVFQITPLQSYYSAKGIAGNIIPAIATTNAIVAGLQMLQVFRILRAKLDLQQEAKEQGEAPKQLDLKPYCNYVMCSRLWTRNGLLLSTNPLALPNPNCFVCRNAVLQLQLDLQSTTHPWTLQDLIVKVLKGHLGFEQPSVLLNDGSDLIWEEGDNADTATFQSNLSKPLQALPCGGIHHGSTVAIEDFTQDLTVSMTITQTDFRALQQQQKDSGKSDNDGERLTEEDLAFKFIVTGGNTTTAVPKPSVPETSTATTTTTTSPTAAAAANGSGTNKEAKDEDDDDVLEAWDEGDAKKKAGSAAQGKGDDDDDDDDDVLEVWGGTGPPAAGAPPQESNNTANMTIHKKRTAQAIDGKDDGGKDESNEGTGDGPPPQKVRKVDRSEDDPVIELDDDSD